MRRSPLSLSLSSSSAALDAGTAMSSRSRPRPRPHFRGGSRTQWRRGFSERPWPAENQFIVSGDSHFQSVRDANLRLQGGANDNDKGNGGNRYGGNRSRSRGGFQGESYGQRPRSEPQFNQRPQFNPNLSVGLSSRPPFSGNQQYRPSPPWQQLQKQRPPFQPQRRPKSDDYRRWEYAKNPPPPQCERFLVLSYNILADYLASSHRSKLYLHIPHYLMDWERRRRSIVFELGLWSPDIICFQEVDKFQDLENDFKHCGYMGTWKMRTGTPTDGCAIFWRTSRFKLVHEECIEFNQLGLRDNVAQICVLQSLIQSDDGSQVASLTSSNGPNKVVICNIHVLYNPKRGEMKLGQVRVLLERAQAVSKIWNDAPVVICGDFNCTPKSPLYNFISEQKLDISKIDRDKVSGQASAQIHPPPQQYNPPAIVNAMVMEMGGNNAKQSNSFSVAKTQTSPEINLDSFCDTKEHVDPENIIQPVTVAVDSSLGSLGSGFPSDIAENISSKSNSEKPQSCDKSLDMPLESGSVEVPDKSVNDTHEDVVDFSKDEVVSASCLSNNEFRDSESAKFGKSFGSVVQLLTNKTDKVPESTSSVTWGEDFDTVVEEKFEGLSLNELKEVMKDDESISEDSESFLSKLHNNEDAFPSDLGVDPMGDFSPVMDSESVDVDKTTYDPSMWTPTDIATATGNADCSLLEHPLKLRSTYSEVEGSPETRESSGEPLVTSYNRCFLGTVDYVWRSEGLETVRVLAPLPKKAMLWTPGFPTKKWGSDHVSLVSELAFTEGVDNDNGPVQ